METNADILKYWNYEKNINDNPSNYSVGSGKVVWWKCEKGHEWEQQIYQFSKKNEKCPYCSNKKLLIGFNDFASCYKDLLKEWNYKKNRIKPDEIIKTSPIKVWWKCSVCDYEWETSIYVRSKGHGCPNCATIATGESNAKIKDDSKSLINVFPDVVNVWNYEKNFPLKPEQFMSASNKRVWWKCSKCGYEWETTICSKSHHTMCGRCKRLYDIKHGNRVYVKSGVNDIATKMPELLMEWDFDKNIINPNSIAFSSATKVWWKCEKGHELFDSPRNRNNHGIINKCPYCSGKKLLPGFNDFGSIMPELLKEWDYEKNKVDPTTIIKGSHLKFYWTCSIGHSYQTSVGNRMSGKGCPYCASQKVLKGFNDFLSNNPKLASEWNYEKNTIKPDEIAKNSGISVWWKCNKGHEWHATIYNRVKNGGNGCPYCSNRVVLKGFNDLKTTHPNLLKEWDYEKNRIQPDEIIAGSTRKVWWKCENGHEWYASIVSRAKNHFCPVCNASKQTSISEKAIVYYLYKCNVNLEENYKIGKKEIDIFIPNKKVGIEYDGQYFHRSISKDIEKNKLCKRKGIELIRVREPELPLLNSSSHDILIKELTSDHSYMNDVIKELFRILNIRYIDIDVERDMTEIYQLFQKGIRKNSIAEDYPELLKEWDYKKNGSLNPSSVSKGNHIRAWWKCSKCGFEWNAMIYSRCAGSGCPNCANRVDKKKPSKLQVGVNDFATEHEEMLKEWDYNKNTILPSFITSGSNVKVWWLCEKKHSYQASITNRLLGRGCPYCAGKKVLIGYNDLGTTNPELVKEWNYEKNGNDSPLNYSAGSSKNVWWKCEKGHEWHTKIYARKNGTGCPICYRLSRTKSSV